MKDGPTVITVRLKETYDSLLGAYGPQHWWPAQSAFEVMVGAVLTQNTAWSNVERAIKNLKQAKLLTLEAVTHCSHEILAEALRPSGYFNVKATRLKNLCALIMALGLEESRALDTHALRTALLSVNGVGPETADDILLYAYDRPVFVIDTYTRRIFSRLGLMSGKESYEVVRALFETHFVASAAIYNEYHALIVRHAKQACQVKPRCSACILRSKCPFGDK
ncbi:MAG: endonuclease III domain-containing protein [Sedimenticola sp.]|nr:endonuclease III domain-containing protein [Sedimenticola sp.]